MMYSIADKLPLRVRATIIRIYNKTSKVSTHILSIFEIIEEDMQEINSAPIHLASRMKDKSDEKICYDEILLELSRDFYYNPIENYKIPDCYGNIDEFKFINISNIVIPSNNKGYLITEAFGSSDISRVIPNITGPSWIRSIVDNNRETLKYLHSNPHLLSQLSEVTNARMGLDINDYQEHIGNIYFVWHHEDIRSINVHGITKPNPGLVIELDFRNDNRPKLNFNICQFEQIDCVVHEQSINIPVSGFKQHIFLPILVDNAVLKIYDNRMNLIHYQHIRGLIQGFNLRVKTPSRVVRDLEVTNSKGSVIQLSPIQKHITEYSSIGKSLNWGQRYFSEAKEERKYKHLEAVSSFIFFDGNPNNKQINRDKAVKYVRDILNSATNICYICDDYFDAPDFGDFVCPLEDENVKVRIINGKKELKEEGAKRLTKAIENYNSTIGKDIVEARMITGSGDVLHDRFIIADDNIWAVGASFNEIGIRASVMYKIPESVGKIIISQIEDWWNNPEVTQNICDIASNKTTNK